LAVPAALPAVRDGTADHGCLSRSPDSSSACPSSGFQEPKRLSYYEGVVIDGKLRIIERSAHVRRVPEPLMPGPPFSDRAVPFTLAQRMSQINIAQTDHPHRRRLDHRHPVPGRIDHGFAQAA
jgi:hypothetical protein